jgi:hypothetical protein
VSGVFQNIDPPPPSPPSECVLPQHQRRGRGDNHSPGGEGGGGSIFWKTPDIGLASYSIIFLRVGVCSSTERKPWAWDPPNLRMLRHKGPDQSIYSPTIRDRHAPENPVDRVTDDLEFHLFGENKIVTVFTKSVQYKAYTNVQSTVNGICTRVDENFIFQIFRKVSRR